MGFEVLHGHLLLPSGGRLGAARVGLSANRRGARDVWRLPVDLGGVVALLLFYTKVVNMGLHYHDDDVEPETMAGSHDEE